MLRNSFYVRYSWIPNLALAAAAIAGLRPGFSAQSLHALQGHQTSPHLPMRGFFGSIQTRIRDQRNPQETREITCFVA
jgi:hypothetical protein